MKEKNGLLYNFINLKLRHLFREAWKSREGMKSSEAMELYIKTMSEIALPLLNKKENEDDDVFMDENELEEENQENVRLTFQK